MGVLVVDAVKLMEDGTLRKPAEEEHTAEPTEGGARVEPWQTV